MPKRGYGAGKRVGTDVEHGSDDKKRRVGIVFASVRVNKLTRLANSFQLFSRKSFITFRDNRVGVPAYVAGMRTSGWGGGKQKPRSWRGFWWVVEGISTKRSASGGGILR